MSSTIQRRTFLAASALAIPTVALAGGGAGIPGTAIAPEFEDLMKQAGNHLKTMRGLMRSLDNPASRDDAAFYANQITVLLAQCVENAQQAHIPERSAQKYADDKAAFTNDLRIKLTEAVGAANDMCRALMQGENEKAIALYGTLRNVRKEGHDEFEEDD